MAVLVGLLPTVALLVAAAVGFYKYILEPIFFSPLSRVPNIHWSAPISRLWILSKRSREQETPIVHAAHQRLGPVIRLAPNEISVNSVDGGIRTVYGGGYEKGNWYLNVFNNYGIMPMFAMPSSAAHSKRKRMLSNIYAKSTLHGKPAMHAITDILLNERLLPELKTLASSGPPIEFYTIFQAITMDFVSAYVFGLKNSTNYVQQTSMGAKFFKDYKARQRYQFWPQELPVFTRTMRSWGLGKFVVPEWVNQSNNDIESLILSMADKAEATLQNAEISEDEDEPQNWPTVYSQLRNALLKESTTKDELSLGTKKLLAQNRMTVASEMLDHTLAGFDTSSITLTFMAWELSRPENAQWQSRLRQELKGLQSGFDAKEIDELPVLQAILQESLRLHAAIPGNQPRVTPASATLGASGHIFTGLPANVRVQSQAWSLHRNPDVFPNPDTWDPSRWLDSSEEQLKEMQRWFWAFGSGGRMCVGSNLAILDMKAITAAIWSTFTTELVDGDGMVHNGGYVAEPIGKDGKWLLLNLRSDPVQR